MRTIPFLSIAVFAFALFLQSCTSTKLVPKNNLFYKAEKIATSEGYQYYVTEQRSTSAFKATIEEKTDYITIKAKDDRLIQDGTKVEINQSDVDGYEKYIGKKYFPDAYPGLSKSSTFKYYDIKFGLQALTIPLKFRRSVGNDTINPPYVETGVNIGFAPGWKFTKNIYSSSKNYLGKNTTQISFAVGPQFGLGATDLKKDSNAPGLLSNRKSPMLTWGFYAMLGFNNINIGYAWGKDYVTGTGASNWVYQGHSWNGIIVSLDILKF